MVPTLGRSRWLTACLEAIRVAGGSEVEILVVDQARPSLALDRRLADRVLRPGGARLGFAGANNLALGAARGRYLATINDDAIIARDWFEPLLAVLEREHRVAAVQGTNVMLDTETRIDGRGIGWNRWWQAVQIDRGLEADAAPRTPHAVYGVSATAALWRREALETLGHGRPEAWFDPRLSAYYEDVDVAGRLRAAGWCARTVPAARARHAGSTTGNTLPQRAQALVYGNRHLVLARLLGRSYWPRLPRLLLRDLADLWQSQRHQDAELARGILRGWWRAGLRLGKFVRFGAPLVPLGDLRRFALGDLRA